jgi:hypothetical protein
MDEGVSLNGKNSLSGQQAQHATKCIRISMQHLSQLRRRLRGLIQRIGDTKIDNNVQTANPARRHSHPHSTEEP